MVATKGKPSTRECLEIRLGAVSSQMENQSRRKALFIPPGVDASHPADRDSLVGRTLRGATFKSDNESMTTETIPLAKGADGVYRVGGTRVTLDLLARAFNRGATAEEIVQRFPSLELSDVYQVIGYYLKYRPELAEYFKTRDREERDILAGHPEWSPVGLRERLVARREVR